MVLPLLQNFRWQKIRHDHKFILGGVLAPEIRFVAFRNRFTDEFVDGMRGRR
jgi:hypothetical protein